MGPKKRSRTPKSNSTKKVKKTNNDDTSSNGSNEVEYEVENIIHHREHHGVMQYLVRWVGYSDEDNTWEIEENLINGSAKIVNEYKKKHMNNANGLDILEEDKKGKKKSSKRSSSKNTSYIETDNDANSEEESCKTTKTKKKKSVKSAKKGKKPANNDDASESGEETSEEYEVEKIVDIHINKNKSREYLVRWKGWSSKDDSWVPEEEIYAKNLIEDFHENLDKIKSSTSQKDLRVNRKKTDRLVDQQELDAKFRHSKRNVGRRKNYQDQDEG